MTTENIFGSRIGASQSQNESKSCKLRYFKTTCRVFFKKIMMKMKHIRIGDLQSSLWN